MQAETGIHCAHWHPLHGGQAAILPETDEALFGLVWFCERPEGM